MGGSGTQGPEAEAGRGRGFRVLNRFGSRSGSRDRFRRRTRGASALASPSSRTGAIGLLPRNRAADMRFFAQEGPQFHR